MSIKHLVLRSCLILALSLSAAAQSSTITGTIKDLGGNLVTSGKIVFTLKPTIDTTLSGTARFVPGPPVTCGINASGQVVNFVGGGPGSGSCVIIQNSSLTPGGTFYQVDLCPYYSCQSRFTFFALTSSYDISTLIPTPGTSPIYGAAGSGAYTYSFVPFSATPTFIPQGSFQVWHMTLTGNVTTPVIVGGTQPSMFVFELTQDATGGRTFTWPSNVSGGGAAQSHTEYDDSADVSLGWILPGCNGTGVSCVGRRARFPNGTVLCRAFCRKWRALHYSPRIY